MNAIWLVPTLSTTCYVDLHCINYNYPTRFFKNTFKQSYVATNYKKLMIGSRGPQLWNRFVSDTISCIAPGEIKENSLNPLLRNVVKWSVNAARFLKCV